MGQTPLHLAAYRAQIDVISVLMEAGADVNVESNDGLTACQLAADEGETHIVNLIERYVARRGAAGPAGAPAVEVQRLSRLMWPVAVLLVFLFAAEHFLDVSSHALL